MARLRDLTIQRKLTAIIMLISVTALLLTGSVYMVYEQVMLRSTEARNLWAQAGVVGDNCRAALAFSESSDAEDTLKSLCAQPTITFACIYTADNKVLAQYQRDEEDEVVQAPTCGAEGWRFEGNELIAFRPIEHNGEVMGMVHLRSTLDHLQEILTRNISTLASLLLVSLAVAYLLMARLRRIISEPILGLTATAKAISQNNEYAKCLVEHGRDELGTLIESFNSMVDTIQESQAKLIEENAERRRAEENLARHLDQVEEEVEKRTRELRESNVSLAREVAERQQAESNLRTAQKRLVETARRAGMADVASEVLHNVGNILNSINVTTTQMSEIVAASKADTLAKVTALLDEHRDDLGVFLSEDSQGKHIPVFLSEVSGLLKSDRDHLAEMLKRLTKNVQHIKDTITTQQSYARVSGVEEPASIEEMIEDAIQINRAGLERHGARLALQLEPLPPVQVNKQKVVQILVNLINNSKHALSYRKGTDRVMRIRLCRHGEDSFRIEVIDNGIGIAQENLTKIFRHGFTTKKDGHGFGLHSSALAAEEMGGSLSVHSNGLGRGARFTLELPLKRIETTTCKTTAV